MSGGVRLCVSAEKSKSIKYQIPARFLLCTGTGIVANVQENRKNRSLLLEVNPKIFNLHLKRTERKNFFSEGEFREWDPDSAS
jgi:hypothetical protein